MRERASVPTDVDQGDLAHGSARRFGPIHDVILVFGKTPDYSWGEPRTAYDPACVESKFTQIDDQTGRRFPGGR